MACPRPGDKPLPELMKFSWPTHIRVTWSQWVEHIRETHWLDFILISVLASLHYQYLSWLLAPGITRFLSLLNTTPSRLLNCISLYMEKNRLYIMYAPYWQIKSEPRCGCVRAINWIMCMWMFLQYLRIKLHQIMHVEKSLQGYTDCIRAWTHCKHLYIYVYIPKENNSIPCLLAILMLLAPHDATCEEDFSCAMPIWHKIHSSRWWVHEKRLSYISTFVMKTLLCLGVAYFSNDRSLGPLIR